MYSLVHQYFLKCEGFLPRFSAGADGLVFLGSSIELCGLSSVLVYLCTSPPHSGCRCGLSMWRVRGWGFWKKAAAASAWWATNHDMLSAQRVSWKEVVGAASWGLYKMFAVGKFMVLAHDLRFTYWKKSNTELGCGGFLCEYQLYIFCLLCQC